MTPAFGHRIKRRNHMEQELLYRTWLSLLFGAASLRANRLVEHFGSAYGVFCAGDDELLAVAGYTRKSTVFDRLTARDLSGAKTVLDKCRRLGMRAICPGMAEFPRNLANLPDAPMVLYVMGSFPDFLSTCSVGIVGSRKMSVSGMKNAATLAYGLAAAGVNVVSGGARGIDSAAMSAAIEAGGTVIGIIGSGLDVVYPKENRFLFSEAAKHGAMVSEYPPGTRPDGKNFPKRNRLISALSQATCVVECAARSGALITAKDALLQGRALYAMPGRIGDEGSEGPNSLIKDGALPITGADDIVADYEFHYPHSIDRGALSAKLARLDADELCVTLMQKYSAVPHFDNNGKVISDGYGRPLPMPRTQEREVSAVEAAMSRAAETNAGGKPPARVKAEEPKAVSAAPVKEPVRIDLELLEERDMTVYNAMTPNTPLLAEEIPVDLPISAVMASLTMLELSGAVECSAGGYFTRLGSEALLCGS